MEKIEFMGFSLLTYLKSYGSIHFIVGKMLCLLSNEYLMKKGVKSREVFPVIYGLKEVV
jgi:hypothetical protein